jgi:hypothetical protein
MQSKAEAQGEPHPDLVITVQRPASMRLASIDSTTHCEPNLLASAVKSMGFDTAAELTATFMQMRR